MNFAGARARLRRLEKSKPDGFRFDWRVFTGEVEPDLDTEPFPGHGMTWREIVAEPRRDPLDEPLAQLHAEHPDKPAPPPPLCTPPEATEIVAPASSGLGETASYELDYPLGYVAEPEPLGGYEYDNEPQPEGDDDADDC